MDIDLQIVKQYIIKYIGAISMTTIIELIILGLVIYNIYKLVRSTRAWNSIKGLIGLYALMVMTQLIGFTLIPQIIQGALATIVITITVIFHPEIRMGLERIGRRKILYFEPGDYKKTILEISKAVEKFSSDKTGALMVIEQNTGLKDYTQNGKALNADISFDLLALIFENQSLMHDGAIIIRENKILAAQCILPLSMTVHKDLRYGTRHRAAIGITQISDAISIVVSEETGDISIVQDGLVSTCSSKLELRKVLLKALRKNHIGYAYKERLEAIQRTKGMQFLIENAKLLIDILKYKTDKENKKE